MSSVDGVGRTIPKRSRRGEPQVCRAGARWTVREGSKSAGAMAFHAVAEASKQSFAWDKK